jgi:hypothetical protein
MFRCAIIVKHLSNKRRSIFGCANAADKQESNIFFPLGHSLKSSHWFRFLGSALSCSIAVIRAVFITTKKKNPHKTMETFVQ